MLRTSVGLLLLLVIQCGSTDPTCSADEAALVQKDLRLRQPEDVDAEAVAEELAVVFDQKSTKAESKKASTEEPSEKQLKQVEEKVDKAEEEAEKRAHEDPATEEDFARLFNPGTDEKEAQAVLDRQAKQQADEWAERTKGFGYMEKSRSETLKDRFSKLNPHDQLESLLNPWKAAQNYGDQYISDGTKEPAPEAQLGRILSDPSAMR
eukprot:gnl/TRDRNA2_/TRDRNA2_187332_c0_seq1.p1 gnl/TRDRNA2_/TRDRNA2_187332_c0~~gnl/TRDRNA2_/TRDRNA2_187332_c0_seq1.p1  ORF type:complete len:208 (+),score=54.13 gnl/TRDRNA2_/TRDRNA2_187332_c0_seq1:93-716(+)